MKVLHICSSLTGNSYESTTDMWWFHRKLMWKYYRFIIVPWQIPVKVLHICYSFMGKSWESITNLWQLQRKLLWNYYKF